MSAFRSRLLVLAWAMTLGGCTGYSHYFATPKGAENVKTVAIEIFKNRTLYTDLEFEFTAALQHEVSAKTALKIASRGDADALITGVIESYKKIVRRENEEDEVSRYSIVLSVSYTFTRLPSGGEPAKEISSARRLVREAEYEVQTNITEADARAEAVRKIARKVVSYMFEKW